MLIFPFLLLLLLLPPPMLAWNERVKCSTLNPIISNPRISVWEALLLRNPASSFFYSRIVHMKTDELSLHQRGVVVSNASVASMHCSPYLRYGETCCSWSSFQRLSSLISQVYGGITFANLSYPIFKDFLDITKEIEANSCPINSSQMSQSQLLQPFEAEMRTHNLLLQEMVALERTFINQTLCMFCLSPKDFPSFIYPDQKSHRYHSFMLNQQYFDKQVEQITLIYEQLEQMHDRVVGGILDIGRSFNSVQYRGCLVLMERVKKMDHAFFRGRRICTQQKECRAIAVRYFGEPAAPQNVLYIKQKSENSGIGLGASNYVLSLNPEAGFKGEANYPLLYGTRLLPKVKILDPSA